MRERHPITRRGRLALASLAAAAVLTAVGVGLIQTGTGAAQGGDPELVLDHFKCYGINAPPPARRARLTDQFESREETLAATPVGQRICNPASKEGRPRLHLQAHLRCYPLVQGTPPFEPRQVEVGNQFAPDQTFLITNRESLCVPSRKGAPFFPPSPDPEGVLDHFKCYTASGVPIGREVLLEDQFGTSQDHVLSPVSLCNPVEKDPLTGQPPKAIKNPDAHLACYQILSVPPGFPSVRVRNQFEPTPGAPQPILKPETLCVPSTKRVPKPTFEHFKCYDVDGQFDDREVTLEDQFEKKDTLVRKPLMLCNPVDKNGEGIQNRENHLVCYEITDVPGQPHFRKQRVATENQFGSGELEVKQPKILCVPSSKAVFPPTEGAGKDGDD